MNAVDAGLEQRLEAVRRHLRGVRRRLFWVFLAFGLGASLTWYYRKVVIGWLLGPAQGHLSAAGPPVFTSPTEMLETTIRLTMVGGLVVAAPMLVFQVARFLSPVLNRQQRRFAAIFLPSALVCYLTGTAFAYFVLLPAGLAYLLQFGTDVAVPMVRVSEYLELTLAMLFWLGVVFELPLAMFLLVRLRLVSYQRIRRFKRRYVLVAALIFSAIITPSFDYVNLLLVTAPIVALYEVGLGLAWLASRSQRA